MVLSMIWSLTSNSLRLHCNTKIHSPLTMTAAVIVPRLTIDGQKVRGVGFHLLTTQKPIKRPGWWEGTFALFWIPGCMLGEGRCLSKGWLPLPWQSVDKSFYRQRGLCVETVQSALTVILKLVIGGLTSVILIVLGRINLQFHGNGLDLCLGYNVMNLHP